MYITPNSIMKVKNQNQNGGVSMAKLKVLVLCALVAIPVLVSSLFAQEKASSHVRYAVDENGNKMVMRRISGQPPKDLPDASTITPYVPKDGKASFYLDNVPCYDWSYGCTATATSMFVGYYDNFGADDCYIGPENGGLQPMSNATWNTQASQTGTSQCPVAATKLGVDGRAIKGHGDDYWDRPDSEVDPYFGAWTEHDWDTGQRSTADFMGTNQFHNWENIDGSTSLWSYLAPTGAKLINKGDEGTARDGIHGMRLFFESLGYEVITNWTQLVDGFVDPDDPAAGPVVDGYTFEDLKASIDAGRPVLVGLDNHSVLAYGYADPDVVYVRSTWYNNLYTPGSETMIWGTNFSGLYHYCMSEIILAPKVYFAAPNDVFALNDNRTVTITWSDPSEGTKPCTFDVYRDGAFLANTTTPGYVDNTASDGVHTYKVKAIYTDPDPDLESFFSNESTVFVSISVTELHDDFEPGGDDPDNQWLFSDTWGIDDIGYNSSSSLSDSPDGLYPNDTESYGGSPCEIAPGLNFSTAADVTMDFWMQYEIEGGDFDYLHLQTCKDGINWVTMKVWNDVATWHQEVISMGVFAGEPNVRVRFLLVSDTGLELDGSNIDDLNITPNTVDGSPPYVFYSKAKDFFDNESLYDEDGFVVLTDITDFTGVDYAKVEYKVDGGAVSSVNPVSVIGNEYKFIIPTQTVGSFVEFRFDCQDTAGPNQGYTDWFFYRSGSHQVYDNGYVSYIVSLSSTPADNLDDYVESIAVKFSSFHDDLVGIVVRGYTDIDQDPNANMIIDICEDNAGLPGASILTGPITYANPADLVNTNAWGYVDLSSEGLTGLDGDYYMVISSDTNASGYTISEYTEANEELMYKYGMTRWKGYIFGGESQSTWYDMPDLNHHMRAVMTDYGYTPGVIDPVQSFLAQTLPVDGTTSEILTLENAGSYDYTYTANILYDMAKATKADQELLNETFDTGMGSWTGTGTSGYEFTRVTDVGGSTLDGTAFCHARTWTGNGQTTVTSMLTSPYFYGSGVENIYVDFDHYKTLTATGRLEVWDGSAWQTAYTATAEGAWGAPVSKSINVTAYKNANMQVRFYFTGAKNTGTWSVDNVRIWGTVPYSWMTLDGGTTATGTVTPTGSDDITVGYDAAGLAEGDYTAKIRFTAPGSDTVDLNVTLTVGGIGPVIPAVPANVVTSIVGTDLQVDWDVSADATGYDVYASDDPYAGFSLVTSVGTNQYSVPADQAKMFYYIVATNATKTEVGAIKKQSRIDLQKNIGR